MSLIFLSVSAFLTSSLLIMLFWPICIRFGHVDDPGGRKKHTGSTPLSGGIGIAAAMVIGGALFTPSLQFVGFAFGVCTLTLLGASDDRRHVSALVRLALQTIAVVIGMCMLGDVRIDNLGNLFGGGNIQLHGWSVAFTVFAAVGVINAVNMIDGMDGLAGGFATLLIAVLLCLMTSQAYANTVLMCLAIGSIFGFLLFNLRLPWQRRARIFLGDAGSLVLGYVLVWFAIEASQTAGSAIKPITIVWLFGLPLCDTVYLMSSRLANGNSPFTADRYHFHHLLQRSGFSAGWALYIWLSVAGVFIGIGVSASLLALPQWMMFVGFLLFFGIYCGIVSMLWQRTTIVRRIVRNRRRVNSRADRT